MSAFSEDFPVGVEELLDILDRSRPAWHADALCHEAPYYISWFNDGGDVASLAWLTGGADGDAEARADARAKAVCAQCLVMEDCRAWALAQGPGLSGVWGGTDQVDRARARARRRAGGRHLPAARHSA